MSTSDLGHWSTYALLHTDDFTGGLHLHKIGNLITCDLVCSGVASPLAWSNYVKLLERIFGKISQYEHRPKTCGDKCGSRLPERVTFANGKQLQGTALIRTWMKAYVGRWNLRPTCHCCPFHSIARSSDITIGDFWGLHKHSGWDEGEGVSLVLINNQTARVIQLVEGLLNRSRWQVFEPSVADNPSQPRLSSSPEPNAVRSMYLNNMAQHGYLIAFLTALLQAAARKLLNKQRMLDADKRLVTQPVRDASGNYIRNRLLSTKGDCYGCGACANACPSGAIWMQEDIEGFMYPHVDEDSCIGCKQCERVCPRRNKVKVSCSKSAYATKLKDSDMFLLSSSGGAFWGLAEQVIDRGGVVYGVAFDEYMMPHNVRCNTKEGCRSCMGSKYAQSDVGDCYNAVRDDLNAGIDVLFTGTPCQVAALNQYLANR